MDFKHLIFYDGNCPLCNRIVRFILAKDKKKQFGFAPLDGKTAHQELSDLHLAHPSLDTLVLLQDYGKNKEKTLIEGKAALRILWLLGGIYVLLGWLSYLPSFLFDLVYRLVARYRYQIFSTNPKINLPTGRFLP